jgi:hypothetical protein
MLTVITFYLIHSLMFITYQLINSIIYSVGNAVYLINSLYLSLTNSLI